MTMNEQIIDLLYPSHFDPLDWRLSTLAVDVAIDLDNASRGKKESSFKRADLLASYLKEFSGEPTNPTAILLLHNSFQKIGVEERWVEGIQYRTTLLSMEMASARDLSSKKLEDLRDYCVGLSKSAMRYSEIARRGLVA